MKTYEYDGPALGQVRSHPWTDAVGDSRARYHDFTASPGSIRTSLEDFIPLERYPAIEQFYALLESINQPGSLLETNDCALTPPHPNQTPQVKAGLECSGRLMLLYRDLPQNTRKTRVSWLKTAVLYQLSHADPKFALGMVGATLVPVRYLSLPEPAQLGEQLMLSFWAFGNDEPSTMLNLARLFTNLAHALRAATARIVRGD